MDIDLKIINILINSQKELNEFSSSIGENIFSSKYRRFIRHVVTYYKTYNSCPTLNTLIEFCAKNNADLKQYINDIWEEAEKSKTDSREYGFYLDKLSKRYNVQMIKQIAEKAKSVDEDNVSSINDSIIKITNEIKNIDSNGIYKEINLNTYVEEWKQNFFAKAKDPELSQGILSGFSMFDYYTNGVKPSELWCIGGTSNSGKSIYLINLAVNMFMGKNKMPETFEELVNISENNKWEKAYNILFISLEMPAAEIVDRIISNMARVNSLDISKGIIGSWDVQNIKKALYYWGNSPNRMKIVDMARGCTVADIHKIYEDTCLEFKPDVIIIDYMGIMQDVSQDESNQDWLKLEKLSENLHELCRITGCPVWTALQLTQNMEQGKAGVGFFRIARAKGIIRNLNGFLMIEDRESEYLRPDSKIHCLKFRRGPLFVMTNIRKEFQYARFADLGYTPEKEKKVIGSTVKPQEDLSELIDKIFGQDKNDLDSNSEKEE